MTAYRRPGPGPTIQAFGLLALYAPCKRWEKTGACRALPTKGGAVRRLDETVKATLTWYSGLWSTGLDAPGKPRCA